MVIEWELTAIDGVRTGRSRHCQFVSYPKRKFRVPIVMMRFK